MLVSWSTGTASRLDEAFHMYRTGADGCWESQYFFPDAFHIPVSIEHVLQQLHNYWMTWGSILQQSSMYIYSVCIYWWFIHDVCMWYTDFYIQCIYIYAVVQSCHMIWTPIPTVKSQAFPAQRWNLPLPRLRRLGSLSPPLGGSSHDL